MSDKKQPCPAEHRGCDMCDNSNTNRNADEFDPKCIPCEKANGFKNFENKAIDACPLRTMQEQMAIALEIRMLTSRAIPLTVVKDITELVINFVRNWKPEVKV